MPLDKKLHVVLKDDPPDRPFDERPERFDPFAEAGLYHGRARAKARHQEQWDRYDRLILLRQVFQEDASLIADLFDVV